MKQTAQIHAYIKTIYHKDVTTNKKKFSSTY